MEKTQGKPSARLRAPGSKVPTMAALVLAAAIGVGQVSAYALNLVAAHSMGPELFGELASLLAILLVTSVVALGIQAAGARRIVLLTDRDKRAGAAAVLRSSVFAAVAVAVVMAALSPVLTHVLRLSSTWPTVLIALATIPGTIMGGQLAVAQGTEHHGRLAAIYMLTGLGRAGGGIVGVVLFGSVVGACLTLGVGFAIAILVGFVVLAPMVKRPAERLSHLSGETLHASHSLFALFVLTNIDVVLARYFLPASQAGMYAAGVTVAKVAFWLPQFIGVIAYPRMADHRRGRTLLFAASAVAVIGVLVTAAVAAVPSLVVAFVGGSQYAALTGQVWMFAFEGAAFSFASFLLYSHLAAGNRLAVVVLWTATAILIGLVLTFHSSIASVVTCVVAVAALVCVVGLVDMVLERRRDLVAEAVEAR